MKREKKGRRGGGGGVYSHVINIISLASYDPCYAKVRRAYDISSVEYLVIITILQLSTIS